MLEAETAIANSIESADDILPCNISVGGNLVSQLCWDNFDHNEETRSESETTHITHGILVQESDPHLVDITRCPYQVRTKARSFTATLTTLQACYASRKVEPECNTNLSASDKLDCNIQLECEEVVWLTCRSLLNGACTAPSWNGWLSIK